MKGHVKDEEARRQELERIATSDPERLEQKFRKCFPASALPAVGSQMVEAILSHESSHRTNVPRA